MQYPSSTSSPLSSFALANFVTEGVRTFYRFNEKFESRNNLTLEQFRLMQNNDYEKVNIHYNNGTLWQPNQNGNFIALSMNFSNIYCIDIDENIGWENLPEILKSLPYTLSRTKSLPHFFFRIVGAELKKIQSITNGVAKTLTLGSDNLNFCKGDLLTAGTWEKKDGMIYNYNGELPTLHWKDVKKLLKPECATKFEMNAVLEKAPKLNFVSSNDTEDEDEDEAFPDLDEDTTTEESDDEEPVKPRRTVGVALDGIKSNQVDQPVEQTIVDNNDFQSKIKKLKVVSKLWKPDRLNTYDNWIKFTWAMINSFGDKGRDAWLELSKACYTRTDKAYDESNNLKIWESEFKRKKKDLKGYTVATLYHWAKEDNPELYEKMYEKLKIDWNRLTHAQFAKMLCDERFLGNNVVFTGKKKEMQGYKYNGVYWVDLGLHNAEIKKDLFDRMYKMYLNEFFKIKDSFDEKEIPTILNSIKSLDNNIYRNNVVECLKTEKYVDKIEWNRDRDLFAFEDGIYSLSLNQFIKPEPSQYINWTCGYEYGLTFDKKEMIVPEYEEEQEFCVEFLSSLFTDKDTIHYLLKRMASYLKQMNSEEKADFWTGDGRNGKGTLSKLLEQVLGKYFGELNLGFYTTYEKSADAPNNNLYNLRNARLINTSEVGEDANDASKPQRFITSQFKRITGGDKLVARQPHEKEQIEFYAGKVLIQTNLMPELVGIELPKNFSLRERVVIVRFPFRFTDNEEDIRKNPSVYKKRDNSLKENFEKNVNLKRGFWRLLTKYYQLYLTEGLVLPKQVEEDTHSYFNASNKVKSWFDNYIVEDMPNADKKFESSRNVKDLFEHFCNFNTGGNMKKAQFVEYLTAIAGKSKSKSERGVLTLQNTPFLRGYKIRLNDDETDVLVLV